MNDEMKQGILEEIEMLADDFKYGVLDEMRDAVKYGDSDEEIISDLTENARKIRRHAQEILDAALPEEDGQEHGDGPVVVLVAPYAWGKGRTWTVAMRNLRKAGGNPEEVYSAYVTTDQTAYVNGMGDFLYDVDKPTFKIPFRRPDGTTRPVELLG